MINDHWETYFCSVDDQPAAMMVNLSLAHEAPMADMPIVNIVSIELNDKGEDGLGSEEERGQIYVVEDEICQAIENIGICAYAGRCITQGEISMFFYRESYEGVAEAVASVMCKYPNYTWSYSDSKEEDWDAYFSYLYPDDFSWNCIINRWVRDGLLKQGDNLSIPRPVDHALFFPSHEQRTAFIAEVEKDGFEVTACRMSEDDDNPNDEEEDLPFFLEISRKDIMTESIDEITWGLRVLAEKYEGYYDGCGCVVVN